MDNPSVQRVLISVTDKTGVVDFARALAQEFGAEIVSTGGTARALEEAGVTVRHIDDLTGFPEMMDGRVKTLHPRVHGGLLARRDLPAHVAAADAHGIGMIDMVVVNLYAFEATVARADVDFGEAIENIDIGGPAMLRSAAKNHDFVTVVTDPASYGDILDEMRAQGGSTTLATRRRLELEVFRLTSGYDNAIMTWLAGKLADTTATGFFPEECRLTLTGGSELRYGENPHQHAAFYLSSVDGFGAATGAAATATAPALTPAAPSAPAPAPTAPPTSPHLAHAQQLQGKELSYNNYLDLDAAWAAVREFDAPTCVIVKHLTPCGIASATTTITDAYQRAYEADPVSAFGGVMAFNCPVPAALIEAIYANGQFVEALVAPAYDAKALELLTQKANIRVLETGGVNPPGGGLDFRGIDGGMLVMTSDAIREDAATFTVPTKRTPTADELESLLFAWRACKSVKSNAIVIARGSATVGIGAGQPNRVNSARLAVEQAGEQAQGAQAASDAFMPFADSLEVLAGAGVTAVIQPGGSVRDAEVIAAADAAGMALVFTGHRHFRH
ncbi:MAG: bifunctional phosphoribosylaminoimidazolecarboxamide formyltransferase/inosine monophosphate cyclohydrolase [Coriobacteriales bacterium]|jgi:phosphoribosylaminoimidazolecarboxamide formyltransferase/IMP cyclohydrolase|nr:bifunctional phosphoribosylaminoimidazolecarboxamide formyltransferase/inosine monophosphate cyclohydrolase [Coriobacteriales bacterium]